MRRYSYIIQKNGGNALMYAITEQAAQLVKGQTFTSPIALQESILEEVYAYGKKVTNNPDLRQTFVLNALVALDNAASATLRLRKR